MRWDEEPVRGEIAEDEGEQRRSQPPPPGGGRQRDVESRERLLGAQDGGEEPTCQDRQRDEQDGSRVSHDQRAPPQSQTRRCHRIMTHGKPVLRSTSFGRLDGSGNDVRPPPITVISKFILVVRFREIHFEKRLRGGSGTRTHRSRSMASRLRWHMGRFWYTVSACRGGERVSLHDVQFDREILTKEEAAAAFLLARVVQRVGRDPGFARSGHRSPDLEFEATDLVGLGRLPRGASSKRAEVVQPSGSSTQMRSGADSLFQWASRAALGRNVTWTLAAWPGRIRAGTSTTSASINRSLSRRIRPWGSGSVRSLLGHHGASGSCKLRTVRLDDKGERHLAPVRDLGFCLRDPVVEGVWLGQARAVLLDATPPDVLIGVQLQGAAPGIHGFLKVAGLPTGRLMPHPVSDPQTEQGVLVLGVELEWPEHRH